MRDREQSPDPLYKFNLAVKTHKLWPWPPASYQISEDAAADLTVLFSACGEGGVGWAHEEERGQAEAGMLNPPNPSHSRVLFLIL